MEQQYLQPDVYFMDVRVTEPSIALTSLLITLVCLYAWWRLARPSRTVEIRLFRLFMLLMGCSTLIGGLVGHAFLYALPFIFKTPGWVLGMLAVTTLGQTAIERAKPLVGARWAHILTIINGVELLAALCMVFITLWFPLVEIHSAFGMLLLLGALEGWTYFKTRRRSSQYLLWSILFAVAAAGVHVAKFSLGTWFTFFDIGHVLMCGTICMILRAAEISAAEEPVGLA